MGSIGTVVKVILISWIVLWIWGLAWSIASGQIGMASLLLVGLIIPLAFIAYGYWSDKKRF